MMLTVIGGSASSSWRSRTRSAPRRSGPKPSASSPPRALPTGRSGGRRSAPPDKVVVVVVVVLDVRKGEEPTPRDPSLPTSNVVFHAEELPKSHRELVARGVLFPVPEAAGGGSRSAESSLRRLFLPTQEDTCSTQLSGRQASIAGVEAAIVNCGGGLDAAAD
jgi:hypothetical protein